MDFIFEFLAEIILEGTICGSSSKIVPKPIRILLLLVVLGIYGFLIVCLTILAVRYRNDSVCLIFIGVDILFIWFLAHIIRKFCKKWKE